LSKLTPETIDSVGLARLKNLAKQLHKSSGGEYVSYLEYVAKQHGFKNWNNAVRFANKNSVRKTEILLVSQQGETMLIEFKKNKRICELYLDEEGYFKNAYDEIDEDFLLNLANVLKIEFGILGDELSGDPDDDEENEHEHEPYSSMGIRRSHPVNLGVQSFDPYNQDNEEEEEEDPEPLEVDTRYITFVLNTKTNDVRDELNYAFPKPAMGEYNRIKRMIREYVIEGKPKKKK
jgi:hypothetical protein